MTEKKPLEIRDNKIPNQIDWEAVSEVRVHGKFGLEGHNLVHQALSHRVGVQCMDDEAQNSMNAHAG